MKIPPPFVRICAALLVITVFGACVAPRNQLASLDVPPPDRLNLTVESGGTLLVTLDKVIVHHGPGSWKRNAYWDEYVVSIDTLGGPSRRLAAVRLIDLQGEARAPGTDWMELYSRSYPGTTPRKVAAATVATGRAALIMAGGIGIVGGLLGLMLQNGHLHGSDGKSNVVPGYFAAAGLAALVVLPEAAAERKVADEFQRRKLVVPAGLLANGTVHGSLFFPPTPAAKTLELTFTGAGAPERVAIDLAAVRNLSRPPLR